MPCGSASCASHRGRAPTIPARLPEPPPYAVGDTVPADRVEVLLNTDYHGLPPSDGSFWYIRAGRHVYRMDPVTLKVLKHVTDRLR